MVKGPNGQRCPGWAGSEPEPLQDKVQGLQDPRGVRAATRRAWPPDTGQSYRHWVTQRKRFV